MATAVSYGYIEGGYASSGVVLRPRCFQPSSDDHRACLGACGQNPFDAPRSGRSQGHLAGVETKQTGEVRQFATSKLASGQIWDDYKVVIEMTRDGKTVREERTLKLTGGQDQELAVNFESDSNPPSSA